jgi:hypothetical protein
MVNLNLVMNLLFGVDSSKVKIHINKPMNYLGGEVGSDEVMQIFFLEPFFNKSIL